MTHDKGTLEVVMSIAEKLPSLTDWAEEGDGPLAPWTYRALGHRDDSKADGDAEEAGV